MTAARVAYLNARLLDPASGLDTMGALLIEDGKIADFGAELFKDGAPSVSEVIDCEGRCLAPGLVDMRVQLREPGEEHKETIETASPGCRCWRRYDHGRAAEYDAGHRRCLWSWNSCIAAPMRRVPSRCGATAP